MSRRRARSGFPCHFPLLSGPLWNLWGIFLRSGCYVLFGLCGLILPLLLPWLLSLVLCVCLPVFSSRSLSKNALSYFLCHVFSSAGALRDDQSSLPRAHSIRGVASSAAFLRNCSVSKVLEAATWWLNPVFASFYLRNVSFSSADLHSLRPFVTAGSVVL